MRNKFNFGHIYIKNIAMDTKNMIMNIPTREQVKSCLGCPKVKILRVYITRK